MKSPGSLFKLHIHLNKAKIGRNKLYGDFIIISARIEYYKSTESFEEGEKAHFNYLLFQIMKG